MLAAAFIAFYAIPEWVSSPSNVRNIILSPLFWPYCLAGLTALTGLGLILTAQHQNDDDDADVLGLDAPAPVSPFVRLLVMGGIMIAYVYGLPRIGMVWSSMIAFIAVAFLIRTHHPLTAIACGIVVPLILYAFFAHVAGVAIPQGEFVRLP